jgi:putative transposase
MTGMIDVAGRSPEGPRDLRQGHRQWCPRRELAWLLGVRLSTLQRWRRQFPAEADGVDRRKGSHRNVAYRLSEEERKRNLLTCSEPEFAALPAGQIMPDLADRGL